jgi:phage pi2 protein 07
VIYTAQERIQEAADSEEDEDAAGEDEGFMYVPDLPKGVRGVVNSLVDVIGRIYVVTLDGEDGKKKRERRLWLGETLKYDTGYRSDYTLPDMLKRPTVPRLIQLMDTGTIRTATTKKAARSRTE